MKQSIRVLLVPATYAATIIMILMYVYRGYSRGSSSVIIYERNIYARNVYSVLHNTTSEAVSLHALQNLTAKKLPEIIQERKQAKFEFTDCMGLNRVENSSQYQKVTDLCKIFTGTTRTDCIYKHPNVVKYVKFTSNHSKENTLSFRDYLSIYSVDRFYKPDRIIIYCDLDNFTGKYWELANNLSTPIEVRHADRITSIGKKHSKPGFITHEADYFKVSNGFKEGGIFSDFDVVILNGTRLREMQMKSELVIGRDNDRCDRTCAGFFSVVLGSKFMKKWLDGYEDDYKPGKWIYNAGGVPSKLLRDCPWCYDVTVDSHMSNWDQVSRGYWRKKDSMLDWKKKAVAHYMRISRFMKPIKQPEDLLNTSTPLTEMFKFILGDTLHEITSV